MMTCCGPIRAMASFVSHSWSASEPVAAWSARTRPPPKVRYVQTPAGLLRKEVPRDHWEAKRHSDAPRFWEAMLLEMESQQDCGTFEPVSLADHPNVTPIPLGWVYDIKVNTLTNALNKYKARLIARGNHALVNVHFFDTYSGVVRMSTVRLANSAWHHGALCVGRRPPDGSLVGCYAHGVHGVHGEVQNHRPRPTVTCFGS